MLQRIILLMKSNNFFYYSLILQKYLLIAFVISLPMLYAYGQI